MEKHSEKVKQIRRKLLCEIEELDFDELSILDVLYLYALTVFSEAHLRDSVTGGEEY